MAQLIMEETQAQQSFQKFELVWAKILGWPWWPARITQIPSEISGNYRVQFFADTSHAYLPAEKIMNFIQGRIRHSTPKGNYRNFVKALGLANKLLQTSSSAKQEAQSECSPREKLSAQQIQIINYSQQEKNIVKDHQDNKPSANQSYHDSAELRTHTRKPKQLIKRRDRVNVIQKSSRMGEEQQNLRTMLKKYKLEQIVDRRPKIEQTKTLRKRKLIKKNGQEKDSAETVWRKAASKICKALSGKDIDLQQRFKITLSLLDSLFRSKEKGVQGAHRALFQWISSNDGETIQKSYTTWPAQSKSDPLTDCF